MNVDFPARLRHAARRLALLAAPTLALALAACGTVSVEIAGPAAALTPASPPPTVPSTAALPPTPTAAPAPPTTPPMATGVSAASAPAATPPRTAPSVPPSSPEGIGPAGTLPAATVQPRGAAIPAGWKVYQTPPRQPAFALPYPPDWTIEEDFTNAYGPQVYFRLPADPQRVFLALQIDRHIVFGAEAGDERRDTLVRYTSGCEATVSGLDVTREHTFAGTAVKAAGVTCDARGGLQYLYLGAGLGTDPTRLYAPWYFRCRAPYGDYQRYADTVFLPMLTGLTLTPPSKPR